MSAALNESSAIQHFEHSDAIEIRNGIIFDFYTGLPHTCMFSDMKKISMLYCRVTRVTVVHLVLMAHQDDKGSLEWR